ncbi:MaoC family dehydratase [Kitasatospora sp. NPDC002543]
MSTASLPPGYREISTHRVREVVGPGYHDLTEGLVIEHRPGRTITDTDNTLITALSGNTAPIHLDAHYAAQTPWRRILVCSGVTLTYVAGMTVRGTSGLTLANLGLDDVRFEHPVFVGDTLYAETEVIGRRLSKSRPGEGIVTCRTTGLSQDNERVVGFTRTFLVPTDPAAARGPAHY